MSRSISNPATSYCTIYAWDVLFTEVFFAFTIVADCVGLEAFDQRMRLGHVVALARAEQQADRVAEGVGRGVDFRAQPAAGAAKALSISPPLAIRAPAAC